jgi:hypothetical protein
VLQGKIRQGALIVATSQRKPGIQIVGIRRQPLTQPARLHVAVASMMAA